MFCEGLGAELVGFERFGVIMFFRKAPPQTEGRRDADHKIKTPPVPAVVIVAYMVSYENTIIGYCYWGQGFRRD